MLDPLLLFHSIISENLHNMSPMAQSAGTFSSFYTMLCTKSFRWRKETGFWSMLRILYNWGKIFTFILTLATLIFAALIYEYRLNNFAPSRDRSESNIFSKAKGGLWSYFYLSGSVWSMKKKLFGL